MKRVVVFVSLLVAVSLILSGCGAGKDANHLEEFRGIREVRVLKS